MKKNPPPGVIEGDPPAQGRPDRGCHDGRNAIQRKGQASLLRWKGICQDGLSHRLQPAAASTLQHPEEKKKAETWRHTAEQRTHGKDTQTGHEKALSSQGASQPAADWQDDRIRDQIRSQHPRTLVVARAQIPGHIRQGHVRDAGVEDLHEGSQRHHDRNEPGIVPGLPGGLIRGGSLNAVTHCRCTFGSTLMPGRSWRSRFSPGSRTIFTGMRWTILT
jgi:hypothetical protein